MSFLIVLLCIVFQRYLDFPVPIIGYDWFKPYTSFLEKSLSKTPAWSGFAGVASIVLPVSLLVALVSFITRGWMFGLFRLGFSTMILLYCLDARDYTKLLSGYLGQGDAASARDQAEKFIGNALPKNEDSAHKALTEGVFIKSLHQVFSVIFWFLLLGSFGVVVYYVVSLLNKTEGLKSLHKAASQVLGVLDWVPVRLLGLSFALVGSFANVYMPWVKSLQQTIAKSNELAVTFGLASLGIDGKKESIETVQGAIDLCFRSQIVWVVILGLVSIASYF